MSVRGAIFLGVGSTTFVAIVGIAVLAVVLDALWKRRAPLAGPVPSRPDPRPRSPVTARHAGDRDAAGRPRAPAAEPPRRAPPGRRPHPADRAHDHPVRRQRDRRAAAGRAAAERRVREPDRVQERLHGSGGRRCRGRRGQHGARRDLHPPRRRRADRDVEHGGDDPDRRRLRRPASQSGDLLPRHRGDLRDRRDGHGQLVDDRRHARRRVRRDGEADGPLRGGGRRRRHLRRLLRRQDDAPVGDDDPRPEARGPWPDGLPPRPQHVLDRRPGARAEPRHLPDPRPGREAERERQHGRGAPRARRHVQHHGGEPAADRAAGRVHREEGPAVPGDPRLGALRGNPRVLHAVVAGQGVRRRARPRRGPDRDQGDLRGDGDRVPEQERPGGDRPALLARRHGEPPDDRVARARGPVVRGDPRARRLPRATAPADREPCEDAAAS